MRCHFHTYIIAEVDVSWENKIILHHMCFAVIRVTSVNSDNAYAYFTRLMTNDIYLWIFVEDVLLCCRTTLLCSTEYTYILLLYFMYLLDV
jgi:hypothetical protein